MNILLLEDDELIADLVEAVVTGLGSHIRVTHATTLTAARNAWQRQGADLVLCDWNLPDGSGLDLVRLIRHNDQATPVIIISASSDREHVKLALHQGITDFIAKPFDVAMLHQRLQPVLNTIREANLANTPSVPPLAQWLEQALGDKLQLPGALSADQVVPLLGKLEELTAVELASQWKNQTALITRLLQLANNISLKRSGRPVSKPSEAIAILGVPMAVNCAMAMALNIAGGLHSPILKERARHYQTHSEQVAAIARAMALSLDLEAASCHAAGLLSRCGELALLRTLQAYIDQGGQPDESTLDALLQEWGPRYGNRLKIQWGLPIPLRELAGAVHMAPSHATRKALMVMHLAGLRVASKLHGPDAERLLRRAGLDPDKWLDAPA
ncbi:response regulator [Oceanimonas sp. CHS3-5]|uniref:response regulator n=1 Tax=Oceanimonas sp. CHS3-5 TaxID=3068186 RepID=UPI00273E3AFE|nr:response regulator [Oceanimonas sp. CHS3-5]MDP5292946.1 response regulator [Oceanimonas sp. CHS3-5]